MASVSVGSATAVQIVGDNPARISLIIVNTHSSSALYLDQASTTTTATAGMVIYAGGNFTEDSGGTKVYCGSIYGIAGENVINVKYWERTR